MPMPDNEEFPGLKLTPEQEKMRDELRAKQEAEWAKQEEEEEIRQAERMTRQVTFALDKIQQHPLLKEMIGLKQAAHKTDRERYSEMALQAILQQPTIDSAKVKEVVKYAMLVGEEMADQMAKRKRH
jgi:hypothetical protein